MNKPHLAPPPPESPVFDFRSVRQARGLTQQELSSLLNVSQAAVCWWEQGRTFPCLKYLPRLSEVLDIPLEDLIEARIFRNWDNRDN